MNLWFVSDLHQEYRDYALRLAEHQPAGADVLVIAGDAGNGVEAMEWVNRQQAETGLPTVYVPGNHEFYDYDGLDWNLVLNQMEGVCRPDVHLLYNDSVEIGDVRFFGTTLWTDYCYSNPPGRYRQADLMEVARAHPDYDSIYMGHEKFSPEDAERLHRFAVDWLEGELFDDPDYDGGHRVVVTHHLPHPGSLDPRYRGMPSDASYCSRLPDALLGAADVWIHGHTHCPQEWTGPGGMRIACNPMGYPKHGTREGFDLGKMIRVEAEALAEA